MIFGSFIDTNMNLKRYEDAIIFDSNPFKIAPTVKTAQTDFVAY
jgi:hypothetical protein